MNEKISPAQLATKCFKDARPSLARCRLRGSRSGGSEGSADPGGHRNRVTVFFSAARSLIVGSFVGFLAWYTPPAMAAAEPPAIHQDIDPLFSTVGKATPGGMVLVAKDGEIIFEKGYGLANIETEAPIGAETRFRIGSVTKQFTAAAILKLQEQGKLSIQDPLSKFIPDWPRGNEVHLYHLLSHSSGIHDYTKKENFAPNIEKPIRLEELVKSFKNDPFDFDPGKKYRYDNSGYVLLAYIIEQTSGASYDTYLRETFFTPLGMKNTGEHPSPSQPENEAMGYSYTAGAIHRSINWDLSNVAGAGSLYSTAKDLYLWNEALFGGKVLSEKSLNAAFAVALLEGDDPTHPEETGYGYGWTIDRLGGDREISHGGELAGFGSYLLRLPERHLTVVVLLNCVPQMPSLHQWNLARNIAQKVVGNPLQVSSSPAANFKLSADDIARIDGRYEMDNQTILTVLHDDHRVYFQINDGPKTEIIPKTDRTFVVGDGRAEATFVRNKEGQVVKAILKQAGDRIDAPRLR